MREFITERVLSFEGLLFGAALTAITLLVVGITLRDRDGYEVRSVQSTGYACEHILAGSEDQTVARCLTVEECNKICDHYRTITK